MDDHHRQPRDSDRDAVRDQIQRALEGGRIGEADAQIRFVNAESAQSMGELGLVVRDLDLDDPALPANPLPGLPPPASADGAAGVRRFLLVLGPVLAFVAVGTISLIVVFSAGSGSPSSSRGELPAPISPSALAEGPVPQATTPAAPGARYRLDRAGVAAFLKAYRQRFDTTQVVDLTLYDDYVIVRVPVPGKERNTGWRYAAGRFSAFGTMTSNFPGSGTVDVTELDLAALVRNIATARRTLGVEDPTLTYVTLNYRPDFDEAPKVNIYVANDASESGYLATTLAGRVVRAYPVGG